MSRQYFTLDEANALVHSLAPKVKDAVRMHAALRQTSLALLGRSHKITEKILSRKDALEIEGADADQLEQAQAMYELLVARVHDIEESGARVKGVSQGLIDFPTLLNGEEEVLLCWRLGEGKIVAYHPTESGFDGRQSIDGQLFVGQPLHND